MLQLIVLGTIPGTTFQITFTWVLFAAFLMSLSALVYVEADRIKATIEKRQKLAHEQSTPTV